jgi:transposase-like protein
MPGFEISSSVRPLCEHVFVKTEERQLARRLRAEQGLAVREIARIVGVSVSSVSLWVRDVPLTAEQEAVLAARNPVRNGQRRGTVNKQPALPRPPSSRARGRAGACASR